MPNTQQSAIVQLILAAEMTGDKTLAAQARTELEDICNEVDSAADLIEDAITTHIYDTDSGDEIPEDSIYTGTVESLRAVHVAHAI